MTKWLEGITSLRLNRKEQRVAASVAVAILQVTKLHVALILLLVDPIFKVGVAQPSVRAVLRIFLVALILLLVDPLDDVLMVRL